MTQAEKTEAAIEAAWTNNCHDTPADVGLEAHARDLARKLDAVSRELDGWHNPTADAISAILEPE